MHTQMNINATEDESRRVSAPLERIARQTRMRGGEVGELGVAEAHKDEETGAISPSETAEPPLQLRRRTGGLICFYHSSRGMEREQKQSDLSEINREIIPGVRFLKIYADDAQFKNRKDWPT